MPLTLKKAVYALKSRIGKNRANNRHILFFCLIMALFPIGSITRLGGTAGISAAEKTRKGGAAVIAPPPGVTKYLGKDYIDSTVNGAIYIINDAATTAGVGFRQKEAIAEARRIAERLKEECRGDPNERYALWKINELEWLILLEEKDLVLEKTNQGQVGINQLISGYNAEVAKPRPDFRKLSRLQSQIAELSRPQAAEMASSMTKRGRVVSRDCMVALEKSLMYNDVAAADETFKYCLRNRSWLAFSDDKFEQLEARMSACSRSKDEFPEVKKEADRAQLLIAQVRLGEARTVLVSANYRLGDIRSFVPEEEANKTAFRLTRLEADLGRCEDSLVAVNSAILKAKGVTAANQYLQTVLRPAGVSNEKMAGVDRMLLSAASPSSDNSKVTKEIDAVAQDAGGGPDVMGEMRAKAKAKAQQKQDSVNAVAAKEVLKNRQHAIRVSTEIYGLIQKNRSRVAYDFFYNKKPFLEANLTRDAFAMLEGTVKQVVDPKWETDESEEIAYLTPIPGQQKGSAGFSAAPAKPADANNSRATEIIAKIYESLERNEVKAAYQRFDREKSFLKANLEPDAYGILSETVAGAYKPAQ